MPKEMNNLNNNFLAEDEVEYYIPEDEDDYDYDYDEADDYDSELFNAEEESDEEISDDPNKTRDFEAELESKAKSQSILKAIFLSLIGKQSEYTALDKKLQNNTSKIIFMVVALLLLIALFAVIIVVTK